jgi:hypothetical protein
MRKLMLIAAAITVLSSATAQAGQTRSLTLASTNDQATTTDQAKPAEATRMSEAATPADAPKYVERPSAAGTTTTTAVPAAPTTTTEQPPVTDAAKPVASHTAKTERPRHRQHGWTEARIIGELHRHGIYW